MYNPSQRRHLLLFIVILFTLSLKNDRTSGNTILQNLEERILLALGYIIFSKKVMNEYVYINKIETFIVNIFISLFKVET